MYDIETGKIAWSANTDEIDSILATSNGSIYASSAGQLQFLKIDSESGDITKLFPIECAHLQIVQYRLSSGIITLHLYSATS